MSSTDTIAAIATPPGRGGVGIIRISGKKVKAIAEKTIGKLPKPRFAEYCNFKSMEDQIIDMGLALYFPNPNSFTGEDVLELQGHGGPVVLDLLLKTVLHHGARLANPGEFSERAFLNDKIDLTQAEAIADLIDSASEQAARSAVRSLQGDFSEKINALVESLITLRIYVEAAIDFPEEEIDFLSDGKVEKDLQQIMQSCQSVRDSAKQGALLRDGLTLVIAGKPNAGKSTLLNALSGRESAIVTDIPGTTRDVMREYISIDGIPLHIIDTAGLRSSDDQIEQEGIRRAWHEIENADQVLLLIDQKNQPQVKELIKEFRQQLPNDKPITLIINKIDLANEKPRQEKLFEHDAIYLSAKSKQGVELLQQHIKTAAGFHQLSEGIFIARRRHLDALDKAIENIAAGQKQLLNQKAGELLAEDLRQAQHELCEITGEFTSDDLLGKIFSSFCIGK